MTPSSFPRGSSHLAQKPISVRLKGGGSLEGLIHIPDGLSLLHFMGTKKKFLNLTSVRPSDVSRGQDPIGHLSLRLTNIVWIVPLDGTLHISTASITADAKRSVEIELVDGIKLQVDLHIAEEQRMSDYLDGDWSFLPLWSALDLETSQIFERIAVNHDTILSIREIVDLD